MNTIHIKYNKTPVGELILGSFDGKLCLADWRYRKMRSTIDKRIKAGLNADYIEDSSDVIERAISQFEEYFRNERKEFDIPLLLVGTDFQKSVWDALMQVPYGETDTYLGLSKKIGNIKAIRAVAGANGANAISIIVPCHRIIGSDGDLVGYAGGLHAKKK
ncbi:MAG: methylated-DNA--[protein]-cysteine S-methyltransferase, partial [Candidatus Delongbacteria bacterium]|nr:methylated-DNA--[protein]-cysteine S-methyltransferase [Candidatus Delongbacteria bacterium]